MKFKKSVWLAVALSMLLQCCNFSVAFAQTAFTTETVVEAEDASLKGDVLRIDSPYTSNGKYCVSRANTISSANAVKYDDLSWIFDIRQSGQFKIWARVHFSSSTATGLYYRWDNGDWVEYTGKQTSDLEWVELGVNNLAMGTHKLQISHKQANVWYDAVYVTENQEFVPQKPEGVEPMPEKQETVVQKNYYQTQKQIIDATGDGCIIEAESITLEKGMSISTDKLASGGKSVYCGVMNSTREAPAKDANGSMELQFMGDAGKKYTVWIRILSQTQGNDSFYANLNQTGYEYKGPAAIEDYQWLRVGNITVPDNKPVLIQFEPRESGWSMDQIIITSLNTCIPSGIMESLTIEQEPLVPVTALPPHNPPANEHPRVYFRESDVPELIEKLNAPQNAVVKKTFDSYITASTDIGATYDTAILAKIEAKAYYYALYKDEKAGREAVEMSMATAGWEVPAIHDVTRSYGRLIESAAIIYDWCYDLMTEKERNSVISVCTSWATQMEIGWPPILQGSLVGHGAEAQLLRDLMAFAIAIYDERPDAWNYIGGRFYEEFVPEREWANKAHLHHQGGNYGIYRHYYTNMGYLLITGMGLEPPYNTEDTASEAYSRTIYLRRPDGMIMFEGDMYSSDPMTYTHPSVDALFVQMIIGKDPYIKDEFIRVSSGANKNGITQNTGVEFVKYLIYNEPELERKSISNLPLSRYFGSPMGVMAARTGWGDGVSSNAVVAQMTVGEYFFGNHQHKDAGSFQIYYKGPLATDAGFYQNGSSYGKFDHIAYTKQSIAHNTVLVYDPNEDMANFSNTVNDGGQMYPPGIGDSASSMKQLMENPYGKRAEVLAHEIDPKNSLEPDYTYLKGELQNSYSDKVNEFKRSFMFLNLKNDEYPAALLVFDKVTSSNPSFKKTWLLHGQSKPELSGTRTVWTSSPYKSSLGYEYTGKMVADALLPAENNISMESVGGPEEGWNIINGEDITHPDKSEGREENTYRLEISPKTASATDYFLNCIQVTDEGTTKYLDAELVEGTKFYGAKISDRIVMFSKDGSKVSDNIEFTISGSGQYKYTVCDVEQGQWKVTVNGTEQTAYVTADGGVLAFDGECGAVKAQKISDEAAPEKEVQPLGDKKVIYVKCDGELVGMPVEQEMVNGKLVVPVSDLAKRMGLEVNRDFIKTTFTDKEQNLSVSLKLNSNILTKNDTSIEMTNKVFNKENETMVELRAFAEAFNYIVHWNNDESIALLVPNKAKVVVREEGYANIKAVTKDPGNVDGGNVVDNVVDGKLDTIWASDGEGRYIQFELEEETILENVEIIFNPNSRRTPYFEIQVSDNGVDFTNIYDGVGSPDADGETWEVFEFDIRKLIKGKYIRFVGNKSNISSWNAVREIRFKIGEELIEWKNSDEYVKIQKVTPDPGDVDGSNVASNLVDGLNRTLWAALGRGRYVDFELEQSEEISGVEIVFNPNNNRTAEFEVQISQDGLNYTSVYKGKSDPNAQINTWEAFNFNSKVNAKYVRYIGDGSNISMWNGVREFRIKK